MIFLVYSVFTRNLHIIMSAGVVSVVNLRGS